MQSVLLRAPDFSQITAFRQRGRSIRGNGHGGGRQNKSAVAAAGGRKRRRGVRVTETVERWGAEHELKIRLHTSLAIGVFFSFVMLCV
jgi:hypothetical protein